MYASLVAEIHGEIDVSRAVYSPRLAGGLRLGEFNRPDPGLGKLFWGDRDVQLERFDTLVLVCGVQGMMGVPQGCVVADAPVDSTIQVPLFQPSICAQVNLSSQCPAACVYP